MLKNKKVIAAICLTMILMLTLATACAPAPAPAPAPEVEEPEVIVEEVPVEAVIPTIAFIQRTMSAPYYVAMWDTMAKMSLEEGFRLIALNANLDATTYIKQVEDVIAQGVDGVIVNSVDASTMASVDQKFVDAGIPLVYIDTPVLEVDSVAIVQSDNFTIGKGAGLGMAARLNNIGNTDINLAHLHGPPGDIKVGPDRYAGFLAGLEEGGITYELVAAGNAEYTTELGLTVTEDFLVARPEIEVIFANNDSMALGALAAVQAAGRFDILISGIDGQKEGFQAIKEGCPNGQYVSTGLNSPVLAATQTIEILLSIIRGEATPGDFEDVIFTPAIGIDCTNIDEFYDPLSVF